MIERAPHIAAPAITRRTTTTSDSSISCALSQKDVTGRAPHRQVAQPALKGRSALSASFYASELSDWCSGSYTQNRHNWLKQDKPMLLRPNAWSRLMPGP